MADKAKAKVSEKKEEFTRKLIQKARTIAEKEEQRAQAKAEKEEQRARLEAERIKAEREKLMAMSEKELLIEAIMAIRELKSGQENLQETCNRLQSSVDTLSLGYYN